MGIMFSVCLIVTSKKSMAFSNGTGHTWSDMNVKPKKLEGDIQLYKYIKCKRLCIFVAMAKKLQVVFSTNRGKHTP
jgi:hypothetical protein